MKVFLRFEMHKQLTLLRSEQVDYKKMPKEPEHNKTLQFAQYEFLFKWANWNCPFPQASYHLSVDVNFFYSRRNVFTNHFPLVIQEWGPFEMPVSLPCVSERYECRQQTVHIPSVTAIIFLLFIECHLLYKISKLLPCCWSPVTVHFIYVK